MTTSLHTQKTNSYQQTLYRMRRAIGWVGFGLPLALLVGVQLFAVPMQNSMSEFFFTGLRDVFTMALGAIGLFLITYHGHPPDQGEILTDYRVSTLAGIAALVVAFTPTLCANAACYAPPSAMDKTLPDTLQSAIHFGAAGVFFACLAIFCLILFTKSNTAPKDQNPDKKRRNATYRTCGGIIIVMIIALLVFKLVLPDFGRRWDTAFHFTFVTEAIAVMAFGISWLIKGETLRGAATTFLYGKG